MRAVHFLRSRQEERELAYWLALAAYDIRDRSINNRIYLVYLILFFGVWTFVTLTFFAGGGAAILGMIAPADPVWAAVFIEVLLLGLWSVAGLWTAARRSPVVFSDPDSTLICQTPVSRRQVTFRWLWMPWLKSAVPFWLIAVTLGFSLAETSMAGSLSAGHIGEYALYGGRAWLALIPVHLGLYALQWAAGIYRLHKNVERGWLFWLVVPAGLAFFSVLLIFLPGASSADGIAVSQLVRAALHPLSAGFAHSQFSGGMLAGGLFSLAALALMLWSAAGFSLSRAAEETREIEVIRSAVQYGFAAYAEQLRTQRRLGKRRAPSRLPAAPGARIMVWKGLLQSRRSFRLAAIFPWLGMLAVTLFYTFLPDPGSRMLTLAFWAVLIERVAVIRLRSDLANWTLARQLPIPAGRFLLLDLGPATLLAALVSAAGLAAGAILLRAPLPGLILLVPGIAVIAASLAAFDVVRRSRSDILAFGTAPELSAGGMLLGLLVAAIPVLVHFVLPGRWGLFLAVLLSVGPGYLSFRLAVDSFRRIDAK